MRKYLLLTYMSISYSCLIASGIIQHTSAQYGFVENKGQIINQHRIPNNSVLYLYSGNGFHVQLKNNGFSYELVQTERKPKAYNHEAATIENSFNNKYEAPEELVTYIQRVDISFVGANPNCEIIAYEPSQDYINYYSIATVPNGITNIHHYKRVIYKNVYYGIDAEFLISDNGFKYNFILQPGADVASIKLHFSGANNITLTNSKNILIETDYGNIEEQIPYTYQPTDFNRRVNIKSNFKHLALNLFGIEVEKYNTNNILVIDPIPWATYYGGSNNDICYDIAKDKSGNLLITGNTASTSNIATSGAYKTIFSGGSSDAFITKFSSVGNILWGTFYGGSGNYDDGFSIATDTVGNILVAGRTNSDTGISTSGAFQSTIAGSTDAFIVKFGPTGNRLWGSYYGGSNADMAYGIATDTACNVLLAGYTQSTTGIASSGAFDTTYAGNNDAFLVKFNSNGNRIWATYFGGSGNDVAKGVATDKIANIVITGSTSSTTEIATFSAHQNTYGGSNSDAFVAKFTATGGLWWSSYYGGASTDVGNDITCDISKGVCVTGFTSSTNLISTTYAITDTSLIYSGYQASFGGGNWWYGDAFVVKFTSTGVRLWGTYYGGNSDDRGMAINTDTAMNVLFIGCTFSTNNIASTGAYQTSYGGGSGQWGDAFLVKFTPIGVRLWATYYGGSGDDGGLGIVTDSVANIFVTGSATSTSGIATSGSYRSTNAGGCDAFIAAFTSGGTLPVKWLDFSASLNVDKSVLLNWGTSSEANNDLYEIERSLNTNEWNMVGKVQGRETTNSMSRYQFIDKQLPVVNNKFSSIYYRLKQIDFDGNFEYSKVVSINLNTKVIDEIIVYPNPNSGSFTISINDNKQKLIQVFDVLGNLVYEFLTAESTTNLTFPNSFKGIYFLSIQTNERRYNTKIIVE